MTGTWRNIWQGLRPGFLKRIDEHLNPYFTFTNYRRIWAIGISVLAVTALVPLLVVTVFHYRMVQSSVDSELLLRTERVASNARRAVAFFLEERLDALRFTVTQMSYEELTRPGRLGEVLRHLKLGFGGLTDLSVITASGIQVAYAGPFELAGKDYSNQEWFLECLRNGWVVSDIFRGFRGVPHMIIATKAPRDDGSFFVLRATLDTGRLKKILDSYETGAHADIFLINRYGFIQSGSRFYGEVFNKLCLPVPAPSRRTEALFCEDDQGRPVALGYAYIDIRHGQTPFILMVVKQKAGMLSTWRTLQVKVLWFVGIATLVIILAATLTCTYLVNRLHQADTAKAETMAMMEQNNQLISMGQLAAGVAHEINNPLAVIGETAGYLKDLFAIKHQYQHDEELVRGIDHILEAVQRCGKITKQLLGFVRRFDTEVQPVNLRKTIDDVLVFHRKEAEYRNIQVHVDVAEEVAELETDEGKLQQILVNLVNNAFHAMSDGCVLEIQAAPEGGDKVRLTISDNGCGMPAEALPRIFEPFFTTKGKNQGTGLGLAITYGLVTKLNGAISVQSQENVGTTFIVTLPRRMGKREDRDASAAGG